MALLNCIYGKLILIVLGYAKNWIFHGKWTKYDIVILSLSVIFRLNLIWFFVCYGFLNILAYVMAIFFYLPIGAYEDFCFTTKIRIQELQDKVACLQKENVQNSNVNVLYDVLDKTR